MEISVPATLRRAAARGQTVANGGVIIWDNTAEASKFSEAERNALRSVGFEKLVVAKGEKMLLIQKTGLRKGQQEVDKDGADDEFEEEEEEDDEGLRFSDKSFATGNMPVEVVDFKAFQWVKVKALNRCEGKNILIVPWMMMSRGSASLKLISLKPFMERVVDLAQGFEWDGPVEVVATHIYGRGKFYVAVTRCRDLRMLKISGIEGYDDLRRTVKSNWRAIEFNMKNGQPVPASSKRYAIKQREKFDNLIAQ